MEAVGALRYTAGLQRLWGEVGARAVARQKRVSAAFDESETPGFVTLDLKAGCRPLPVVELLLAIENLLDCQYYEHLNRGFRNLPRSEGNTFYEPGRNVLLQMRVSY